jgi:YD repeat-containing protein
LRKRDGSILSFQYDAANRMSAKIVPERSGLAAAQTRDVYYLYDNRGLQVRARFDAPNGEGVTTDYDGFGRAVSSTLSLGGAVRTLTSYFDREGHRTALVHPDGATFGYYRDAAGRLGSLYQNGLSTIDDYVVRYWYKPEGPVHAAVRGAGSAGFTTVYYYDAVQRPSAILNDLPVAGADMSIGLTYNPAGQIRTLSRDNDSYAWRDSFAVSRDYQTDGQNRYLQTLSNGVPTAGFSYDPNGNLASDQYRYYLYDVENRLVSATNGAALVYDPLGRLFEVSSPATGTTRFLYDGDELVAEYDGLGTLLRRYVHGTGADDPVAVYEGSALGTANRRYMLPDQQGSIVGLVNVDGSPSAINSYDEYGIPGAGNVGRFQYIGQA